MKIDVCYTITKDYTMEVSDEFKTLTDADDFYMMTDEYETLRKRLETMVLKQLPKNAEILSVMDADEDLIVYEN